MKLHPFTIAALGLHWLAACQPATPPQEPDVEHDDHANHSEEDHLDVSELARRNLGITFVEVQARQVAGTLRVPGAFELQPLGRQEYRMALPGRVQIFVDELDPVEPGQTLFRFQSPAWPELLHEVIESEQAISNANAELTVMKAKIEESKANLERLEARVEDLARAEVTRADLNNQAAELRTSLPRLEAELGLARARVTNARRNRRHALHRAAKAADIPEVELVREVELDGEIVPNYTTIDWIEVRAQEVGLVELLAVTNGAFVESPNLVMSTVDPQQVRFRALALQGDLPSLLDAAVARIVPPQAPGMPLVEGVDADVRFGLEAHPYERTLTLLANPRELAPWIRPGVSAFLEVVTEESAPNNLAIPRSAVVQDGLQSIFFRRIPSRPDEVFRVVADLGVSDGRWVEVLSGVQMGDEIVLDGAYELKLAAESQPGESKGGHVHADGTSH